MAGSNQAINLGGMLNQIAGTIGSGYQINGKNAGEAIGGVVANAVRPEIDQNNPESLEKYAQWARNNGRDEEALRYSEKAGQIQKEQSAAQAIGAAQGASVRATENAQYGDTTALRREVTAMSQRAQTAAQSGDLEQARIFSEQARQMQAMMPAADEAASNKKASGVIQMQKILDDGKYADGRELTEQNRAGLEQAINQHMQNPAVVTKTNQLVKQRAEMDNLKQAQKEDAAANKFLAESMSVESEEELQDLYDKADEDTKKALLPLLNARQAQLERDRLREERNAIQGSKIVDDILQEAYQNQIDAMPEGSAARAQAQAALDAAVAFDDKYFVNGTYTTPRDVVNTNVNRHLTKIDLMANQTAMAVDAAERSDISRLKLELLDADLARFSPLDPGEVRRLVQARFPDEPVTEERLAAMRKEMRSAQEQDYRDLQRRIAPEEAEAWDKEGVALMPEGLTPAQQKTFLKYVRSSKNRAIAKKDVNTFIDLLKKSPGIWPDEEDYNDSTPYEENLENAKRAASMQQTGASVQSLMQIYKAIFNEE